MTGKHLEQTDPRFKSLESRDIRLRAFTSALVVLLGATVVSLYLPQAWGGSVSFLPAPETHTTLAVGILGLAILFYLYVMKRLGELSDVRRELLGTRLREELLRGRLSELSSLFETTADASVRPDRDEMLDLIVRRVLICLEADQCSILLLEEESQELVCGAVTGRDEEFVRDIRVPLGQGIAGWVAEHNEPVVLDDAEMAARFPDERKRGRDISSSLCVPLFARARVVGVLCVNRRGPHAPFTAMDARSVAIFAEHIAGALLRLGELSVLDRRTVDLEASNRRLAHVNRLHEVVLTAARREMRSPLAAIQASADLLQRDGLLMPHERHDQLTRGIHDQAAQLRDVLNEVVDLTRLEAGQATLVRTMLSPNDALLAAVQSIEPQAARRRIRIDVSPSPAAGAMALDGAKWRRALETLLLSGLRLSSPGDTLWVHSGAEGGNLTVTIAGFGSGAAVEDLETCARGLGSPAGGRSAPENLGLGLLVAKRYLELHGATLRLENVNGPAFRIRLPAQGPRLSLVPPPGEAARLVAFPAGEPEDDAEWSEWREAA